MILNHTSDLDLAKEIANSILELDKLVFVEDPIKKVVLKIKQKLEIKGKRYYFQFAEETKEKTERYLIFVDGLVDYVDKLTDKAQKINCKMSFKKELLVISIIGHEIRHRLQLKNIVQRFDFENIKKLHVSEENVRVYKNHYNLRNYDDKKELADELDAAIIELLIINNILFDKNRLKNFNFIAKLICTQP